MLKLSIPERSFWDEQNECFVYTKGGTLTLEHSLLSLSRWESKWKKSFLNEEHKTEEEMRDYIRCMDISSSTNPELYLGIGRKEMQQINDYINDPMTATTFHDQQKGRSREIITNEIIYYWMVESGIPFDPCEKWHLNRLMTLIRVINLKQQPAKKMKQSDWLKQRSELNAARRRAMHSHG